MWDCDVGNYFFLTKAGKEFDIPFIILRSRVNHITVNPVIDKGFEHFDLQDITQKRIHLQTMAQLLGCTPKSGDGMNAIRLWEEGRLDELKAYCAQDVDTTIEIFELWKRLQERMK